MKDEIILIVCYAIIGLTGTITFLLGIIKRIPALLITGLWIMVVGCITFSMSLVNMNHYIEDIEKYGTKPDTTITIRAGVSDTMIINVLNKNNK